MLLSSNTSNVISDEFRIAVALGQVPGWEIFRKFGMNNGVPASGSEEIWPVGTARVLPTSAGALSVVSSSTDDDASPATGAWQIIVEGLDSSYNEITETIALDGTTPVASSSSAWWRVNRAYIGDCGTGRTNAGNITITLDSQTQAYIEAGEGQTHQTHFTVPGTHYVVVESYGLTVGRMAGSTDIQIQSQILLDATSNKGWRTVDDQWLYGPIHYKGDGLAFLLPPKTDVRQVITSTATTQVGGVWRGYKIDSSKL